MQLSDVIRRAIKSHIRSQVYTALPARVIRVHRFEDEQSVDVEPLIARRFEDGTVLASPPIEGVPVQFPSAGGGLLSFPIAVGDTVMLIFSMRSIDEWLGSDGRNIEPINSRSHSLSDAVAIPGLYTYTTNLNPNPDSVELKFKNISFKLDPDNTVTLTNGEATITASPAGDIVAQTPAVTATLSEDGSVNIENGGGNITMASGGEVNINGATISTSGAITSPVSVTAPSVVADGKELAGHRHSGVQSGGSNTGTNI